ncbi:MAG: hypothetical protein ACRDK5_09475 [Solirubrobacterales bacterium]
MTPAHPRGSEPPGPLDDIQTEQTLLIFGASGDLAGRLLLPGLGDLLASGALEGVSLVGNAVDDWSDERWRSRLAESFAAAGATGERVDAVAESTRYEVVNEIELGTSAPGPRTARVVSSIVRTFASRSRIDGPPRRRCRARRS